MNLKELNEKYHGRHIDYSRWTFAGNAPLGQLALVQNDVILDDGMSYDFHVVIELGGVERPSDVRHPEKWIFNQIVGAAVKVGCEVIEDAGDVFADAIDTLIAPAFGMEPTKGAKAVYSRNSMCPWDYPHRGVRSELDAAWERIKRELVHFTAEKYGLPEPDDLTEDNSGSDYEVPTEDNCQLEFQEPKTLLDLRMNMEMAFGNRTQLNYPSWSKSQAWIDLRNAMLDEMFDRVGVTLPPEAHELNYMCGGRKPTTWTRILPRRDLTKKM